MLKIIFQQISWLTALEQPGSHARTLRPSCSPLTCLRHVPAPESTGSSLLIRTQWTYLCCDHDDLQNLHPKFPGYVLPRPVLLTRIHEVKLQVISQLLVFEEVFAHGRAETWQKAWRRKTGGGGFPAGRGTCGKAEVRAVTSWSFTWATLCARWAISHGKNFM